MKTGRRHFSVSAWNRGFRIYLQREEDNVEDSKAIRVMGTCDTFPYGYHLGYLERETAYTGRFTGEMITKGFVVIETGNGYTLFESLNPPVGVFPINGISVRTRVRLTQIPQGNSTRVVATVTMRNQAPGGQAVDYPVVSGRSDMRDVQAILLRCAGQ